MKKCQHKCRWKKTGGERYSFPGQYEQECKTCGKKQWKEYKQNIPTVESGSIQWEEYRKKYLCGN